MDVRAHGHAYDHGHAYGASLLVKNLVIALGTQLRKDKLVANKATREAAANEKAATKEAAKAAADKGAAPKGAATKGAADKGAAAKDAAPKAKKQKLTATPHGQQAGLHDEQDVEVNNIRIKSKYVDGEQLVSLRTCGLSWGPAPLFIKFRMGPRVPPNPSDTTS